MLKPSMNFVLTPISRYKSNFNQDMGRSFYDIIISGGGMIGQTMACALSKNPLFKKYSILLIESSPKKDYNLSESYSNRVSSIVPSTKELFLKLGIWDLINRYQDVQEINVWGSHSDDYVNFSHDITNPAFIIENDEIINAAIKVNSSSPNLKTLYDKTINQVNLSPQRNPVFHEIHLNDNSILKTTLLIGADGANSSIRNAMDVNYISWKYNQLGIVATVNLVPDGSKNTTAWQKFLPDGPIALLPLKRNLSSLVWSVPEKKAKTLLNLPEEVFVDALNEALHSKPIKNNNVTILSNYAKAFLGPAKKSLMLPLIPPSIISIVGGSRAAFPLSFGHSSEYTKPGVVLIGDSAHKVHPLAGQGVNIGFRDIRCLEEKLAEGIINGRPLGYFKDLQHYESEAQRSNLPIMAATDLFHRIYTSQNDVIKAFGDSCIYFSQSIYPIKNLMKQLATS